MGSFWDTTVQVYLIKDLDSGLTKIGYAADADRRLKDLLKQPTLLPRPHNFILLCKFWGEIRDEKYLHEEFADKRVRGEWFDLTEADIKEIRKYFNEDWEQAYEEHRRRLFEIRWGLPRLSDL